jgi:hypothetical protein
VCISEGHTTPNSRPEGKQLLSLPAHPACVTGVSRYQSGSSASKHASTSYPVGTYGAVNGHSGGVTVDLQVV